MTMQTVTTATATARTRTRRAPPASAAPEHRPLEPADDQRQIWLSHGNKPVPFEVARQTVLAERDKDGTRTDVLADLRAWGFGAMDEGRTMAIRQVAGIDLGAPPEPVRLRRRAFNQICDSVGVGAGFIQQLPPQLQVLNMNWLMSHAQQTGGARLLRLAGGEVRAIASDRYAVIDDDLLLELVDDVLGKSGFRGDAMVRASCVGPTMNLRITIPSAGVEVKRGDVIEWGIDLGNSEIGMRSVQVVPASYRLVCLNGMRVAETGAMTRIRHVGDPMKLRDDLSVAIPAAFSEARGDLDLWKRSVDRMVNSALDDLEGLRGFGLQTGETRAVGRELLGQQAAGLTEGQLIDALSTTRTTVYDLTNAITATARERQDVTKRLSLEETAHRYLARKVG